MSRSHFFYIRARGESRQFLRTVLLGAALSLLSLNACSLHRLSPQERQSALSSAQKEHAEMIAALKTYKDKYGFFPARKEILIEEHLLAVSSLPEETAYLDANRSDKSKPSLCASKYREVLEADRMIMRKAMPCASQRAGKRKVSLSLAREICPEFFPPEYDEMKKSISLETTANCALGFPSYNLLTKAQIPGKSAWLEYSSESNLWKLKERM